MFQNPVNDSGHPSIDPWFCSSRTTKAPGHDPNQTGSIAIIVCQWSCNHVYTLTLIKWNSLFISTSAVSLTRINATAQDPCAQHAFGDPAIRSIVPASFKTKDKVAAKLIVDALDPGPLKYEWNNTFQDVRLIF